MYLEHIFNSTIGNIKSAKYAHILHLNYFLFWDMNNMGSKVHLNAISQTFYLLILVSLNQILFKLLKNNVNIPAFTVCHNLSYKVKSDKTESKKRIHPLFVLVRDLSKVEQEHI